MCRIIDVYKRYHATFYMMNDTRYECQLAMKN